MFKNSLENSKKIISLPMYPNLPKEHIQLVCKEIIDFYTMIFPL